jgi:hypothetical protein
MKEEISKIKHAITLLQNTLAMLEGRLPVETEKKQSGFRPPQRSQALGTYNFNGYHFDFDEWWNHYQSNGWKVGKVPMKDWEACMAQWQSRHKKASPDRTTVQLDASGRPISSNGTGRLL